MWIGCKCNLYILITSSWCVCGRGGDEDYFVSINVLPLSVRHTTKKLSSTCEMFVKNSKYGKTLIYSVHAG